MPSIQRLSWEYQTHHKNNGKYLVRRFISIEVYFIVKLDSQKAIGNDTESKLKSSILKG